MTATLPERATLIVGGRCSAPWADSVVRVDSVSMAMRRAAGEDVARIILDCCATPEEFLQLLAALPPDILGDVMLIRDDGTAFLSAAGRGGDRVLYALAAHDVAFYIQTNNLLNEASRFALTA